MSSFWSGRIIFFVFPLEAADDCFFEMSGGSGSRASRQVALPLRGCVLDRVSAVVSLRHQTYAHIQVFTPPDYLRAADTPLHIQSERGGGGSLCKPQKWNSLDHLDKITFSVLEHELPAACDHQPALSRTLSH